eukprot:2667383-Prymnesium_polylepis.1
MRIFAPPRQPPLIARTQAGSLSGFAPTRPYSARPVLSRLKMQAELYDDDAAGLARRAEHWTLPTATSWKRRASSTRRGTPS